MWHFPITGNTLGDETAGSYSRYPWYALRLDYTVFVNQAEGIPFLLPHHIDHITECGDFIVGILITSCKKDLIPHFIVSLVIVLRENTKKLFSASPSQELLTKLFLGQGNHRLEVAQACN